VEASRVAWGKQVDGNARDLLMEPEPDKEARPREAAVDFLRQVLEGGPMAGDNYLDRLTTTILAG
jgi:putative DNA primase/helicase